MRKFVSFIFVLLLSLIFVGCTEKAQEPEFRVHDNHIQWKYKSEDKWTDLISLDDLKGEDGIDGNAPTVEISEDGFWVINGQKTDVKARGEVVEKETHTVQYVLNGGTLPDSNEEVEIQEGDPVPLPIPVREGHSFVGWFDEEGHRVKSYDVVSSDLVLYAKWEMELSELGAFLKAFMGDNHTLKIYYTREVEGVVDEKESILNKKMTDGNLINYNLENPDGENVYISVDESNAYLLIADVETLNFFFDIFPAKELDNILSFAFKINTDALSERDFYKNEEGIYMSHIESETIVDLTGNDYADTAFFYGIVEVDLDAKKLVLEIHCYPGDEYIRERYVIYIADVGTTEVDIPIENAVVVMKKIIDTYREMIADDMLSAFDEYYDLLFARLEEVTDIWEFIDLYNEMINVDLDFEFDDFKEYKYNKISVLKYFIEQNKAVATDESVAEMESILEDALEEFASATALEFFALYNEYRASLEEAFVIDPEKQALEEARADSIEQIYDIYDEFLDYIYYFENPGFKNIRDNYLRQARESVDAEELEAIPANYREELMALDLVYNSEILSEAKNYASYEATEFFYGIATNFRDAYSDEYDGVLDEIADATNPLKLEGILEEFKAEVIGGLREDYDALGKEKYDYYKAVVIDEKIGELDTLYENFLADLEEANKLWNLDEAYWIFIDASSLLPTDYLKESGWNYSLLLEEKYFELCIMATAESLSAMEVAYASALNAIKTAETIADQEAAYYAAIAELEDLYEEDEAKVLFSEYIAFAVFLMEATMSWYNYISENDDYYEAVMEHTEEFIALVEAAESLEAAEARYQEWFLELIDMPFIISESRFVANRAGLVDGLTDQLNDVLDPASEAYQSLYALIEEIGSTYYLPTILENTYDFFMQIQEYK